MPYLGRTDVDDPSDLVGAASEVPATERAHLHIDRIHMRDHRERLYRRMTRHNLPTSRFRIVRIMLVCTMEGVVRSPIDAFLALER